MEDKKWVFILGQFSLNYIIFVICILTKFSIAYLYLKKKIDLSSYNSVLGRLSVNFFFCSFFSGRNNNNNNDGDDDNDDNDNNIKANDINYG
jgi:hypothetical protein